MRIRIRTVIAAVVSVTAAICLLTGAIEAAMLFGAIATVLALLNITIT